MALGILWLCGCLLSLVYGQDCFYQGCWCSGMYLSCVGLGLKSLPPPKGKNNATFVTLDWNLITSLPAKSLPPNIQTLSMLSDPLATIDVDAFDDSVHTLKSLSLSSANFTRVPNAIGRLLSLTELHISNTIILDWNQQVMHNLGPTVNILTLEDCNLKSWPEWLIFYNNLTQISLADNLISSIPDDGLDIAASSVTSLDLQNNSLTLVPYAISKMSALKVLYLEQNQITSVRWLPPNSKLSILSLSINKIVDADQLSQALLPYADTLVEADLASNSLTSIPNLRFMANITYLDFSYNQLSDALSGNLSTFINGLTLNNNNLRSIPNVFMTLSSVVTLILNNNLISQIRNFEFPNWITDAEFEYNLISELTDNSFPSNSSLQYLSLNNNPLYRISNQAFQNVPLLNYLNVQFTRFSRLPVGLLSIRSLNNLDFRGCENLVCTCQEKTLSSWMKPKSEYSILGDCGRTSIYQFFTVLAADCPI